jgi:hypothetical protein
MRQRLQKTPLGYTEITCCAAREGEETMQALAWFGNEKVRVIQAKIPDITQDVRCRAGWTLSSSTERLR